VNIVARHQKGLGDVSENHIIAGKMEQGWVFPQRVSGHGGLQSTRLARAPGSTSSDPG